MPTNRYVNIVSGQFTQVVPATTSAGAGSAGQLVALGSNGLLDTTLMPSGIGANAVTATASATITAGQIVNIYLNGSVLGVRPADSTSVGSEANGFAPSGITSGATGTVNLGPGYITGLSGLVIGTNYFLGTAGAATATVPSTAGNIIQFVGKGVSTTSLDFQPSLTPVTAA